MVHIPGNGVIDIFLQVLKPGVPNDTRSMGFAIVVIELGGQALSGERDLAAGDDLPVQSNLALILADTRDRDGIVSVTGCRRRTSDGIVLILDEVFKAFVPLDIRGLGRTVVFETVFIQTGNSAADIVALDLPREGCRAFILADAIDGQGIFTLFRFVGVANDLIVYAGNQILESGIPDDAGSVFLAIIVIRLRVDALDGGGDVMANDVPSKGNRALVIALAGYGNGVFAFGGFLGISGDLIILAIDEILEFILPEDFRGMLVTVKVEGIRSNAIDCQRNISRRKDLPRQSDLTLILADTCDGDGIVTVAGSQRRAGDGVILVFHEVLEPGIPLNVGLLGGTVVLKFVFIQTGNGIVDIVAFDLPIVGYIAGIFAGCIDVDGVLTLIRLGRIARDRIISTLDQVYAIRKDGFGRMFLAIVVKGCGLNTRNQTCNVGRFTHRAVESRRAYPVTRGQFRRYRIHDRCTDRVRELTRGVLRSTCQKIVSVPYGFRSRIHGGCLIGSTLALHDWIRDSNGNDFFVSDIAFQIYLAMLVVDI